MEAWLEAMRQVLDISEGACDEDTEFQDLDAWDSLALIGVISLADEMYGTVLSPNSVLGCETLGDLYRIAIKK